MARASVRVDVRPGGASLKVVARELRRMDSRQVNEIMRRRLERAAQPYPRRVQASILAIPATGEKHTGLRARIAKCVELSTGADAKTAWASVWINPSRMGFTDRSLPLYMQGAGVGRRGDTRWRHPVYGHNERPWVQQPSHPYFYQAAEPFGRAAGTAINAALGDITRQING